MTDASLEQETPGVGVGVAAPPDPPGSAPASQKSSAGSRPETAPSGPSTASTERTAQTPQSPEKVPPGIVSIFLTDETFKIANIDKAAAKHGALYKISKKLIMDDIQARAAISDFHPIKAALVPYPEEEFLVRYNLKDRYGDAMNIEICISEQAKEGFEKVSHMQVAFRTESVLRHPVSTTDMLLRPSLEDICTRSNKVAFWLLQSWSLLPNSPSVGMRSKAQADLETAQKAAEEERKKPKGWKSLGSEKEITAEDTILTRERIIIKATRKFKDFYAPHKFVDRDGLESWSSSQMEVRPAKDISFDKSLAEQDYGIQAVPVTTTIGTQTRQERHSNNCAQYEPRELDEKRKAEILCSEDMFRFLKEAKRIYIDALQQNEIMDVFEDDFSNFAEEDGRLDHKSISVVTEYQAFFELTYCRGKMISAIDWMPGRQGIVAAACSESKTFDERLHAAGKPGDSYVLVWSFNDPIHPQMVLDGASDIFSLRFNPTNPELIAGGCFNGQVMLWDISEARERIKKKEKKRPNNNKDRKEKDADMPEREKGKGYEAPVVLFTLLSHASMSHYTIVSDIHWLPSEFKFAAKSQQEVSKVGETCVLASISADGKIIFWNISKKSETYMQPGMTDEQRAHASAEKYMWNPFFAMEMSCMDPPRPVGPLKMTFPRLHQNESRFFVSTENGEVLEADINAPEGSSCVKGIHECHNGPVRSLQHSPFFDNILLSVDIWTFAIWREDMMKPIFISRSADGYLTTGCWSPTRPGVIYIGLIDGNMEVWDLLDHSHQPSMVVSVGSCQLTSIEFWKDSSPQLVAVGDIQGILHIMEIPRNLRRMQHKERQSVKSFLDRQKAWRADVEMRGKERETRTERWQKDQLASTIREEHLFRCTWNEATEVEYHRFEYECRKTFGMSLDQFSA